MLKDYQIKNHYHHHKMRKNHSKSSFHKTNESSMTKNNEFSEDEIEEDEYTIRFPIQSLEINSS